MPPNRNRGDVYWVDFRPDMEPHMVLVISRDTNRATFIGVLISSSRAVAQAAIYHRDIVPVEGLQCAAQIRGFFCCAEIGIFEKDDRRITRYVMRLSDQDMSAVELGLKHALQLS